MISYRILVLLAVLGIVTCALGTGAYFGALYGGEAAMLLSKKSVLASPDNGTPNIAEQQAVSASLSARYALWTFWAMVGQTIVAGAALVALLTDLRQTKRSAEAQLRAYVSVEPSVLHTYADERPIRVIIELTNGGSTPAFETWHGGNVVVGTEAYAESEICRSEQAFHTIGRPAPMTVQIGRTVSGTIDANRPLSHDERERLEEEGVFLFVFGVVGYTDAFGRNHWTKFCYRCDQLHMKFDFLNPSGVIERDVNWTITPFHNSSS